MKTHGIKLLAFILFSYNFSFAQNFTISKIGGGEAELKSNSTPCLNETQRAEIHTILNENVNLLRQQGRLNPINNEGGHPLFIWPIIQAEGFDYESVWALSNYVDENPAYPDQITDYNCGTRSYDTTGGYNHQGVDIFTWPFWWFQMDNDQSHVISAAAGQIVGKFDGNYDRSCATTGGGLGNSIYVEHEDGSTTWYGHMKNGSLTLKGIGDTVVEGEYLGVIGSSGNSTGPHLHFEVYDSTNSLIDPYFGSCNTLNPDSWWLNQKPYTNTYINALLTHNAPPVFPTCPETETPNTSDQFYAGETVYFALYLKDQLAGTSMTLKVKTPDNSIFQEWTSNLNDNFIASYWYWSGIVPSGSDGTWTWEATYNGQTVVHPFQVGILGVEDANLAQTKVYPNPLQTTLFIDSESTIVSADIRDILGRSVFEINESARNINEMDVSFLTTGIYFIALITDENQSKTIKLIKD